MANLAEASTAAGLLGGKGDRGCGDDFRSDRCERLGRYAVSSFDVDGDSVKSDLIPCNNNSMPTYFIHRKEKLIVSRCVSVLHIKSFLPTS
jgi:hypothetical protein